MIPISSGVRVWISSGHCDMRKGMQGLALLVQEGLGHDPFKEAHAIMDKLGIEDTDLVEGAYADILRQREPVM